MRVLTLNVWAHGGDWPGRLRALAAGLRELAPELICLQETIVRDGYDQAAELLGDEFHVLQQQQRAPDGMGISIASRWPLVGSDELTLKLTERSRRSPAADFPAGALLADVEVPPPIGRLLIVNHFPSYQVDFERERELQAVAVAQWIDEHAARSQHVVLAGDLDAEPSAASMRFFTGRQSLDGESVCYRDAWESTHGNESIETFTPRNPLFGTQDWPFRRIDHILVRCAQDGSPSLRIVECGLAFDSAVDGIWASDHFGLWAELEARS